MLGELSSAFARRQTRFAKRHPYLGIFEPASGVTVVVPSLTLAATELRRVTGVQHYEERLLFLLLHLAHRDVELVYLTSEELDPAVVEYYLQMLDDPGGARDRLHLLPLRDSTLRPLTEKAVERTDLRAAIRQRTRGRDAWLLPFNVTDLEQTLADRVGLPIYGAPARLATAFGSKEGSRAVAKQAGVPVVDGIEGIHTVGEVERAVLRLTRELPNGERAVIIKLNDGYSGLGNVVVEAGDPSTPLKVVPAAFPDEDETWQSFVAKMHERGAVVERYLRRPGVVSPSALVRITPGGTVAVVATHDQILDDVHRQIYLGCRFPAHAGYRGMIQEYAARVGDVLAAKGVIGIFGVDFLVEPTEDGFRTYLIEINLRLGGTTHPFGAALLACGGQYDLEIGHLVAGDVPKSYIATDNCALASMVGASPSTVIDRVRSAGLAFDPNLGIGTILHMLGAVRRFGKFGFTCIANSPDAADEMFRNVNAALMPR